MADISFKFVYQNYYRTPEGREQLAGILNFYRDEPKNLLVYLFDKLVGGRFNIRTNNTFKDEEAIFLMFYLLPYLPEATQNDLLKTFTHLVERCTVNRDFCCRAGLLEVLTWMIHVSCDNISASQDIRDPDQFSLNSDLVHQLFHLIGVLGQHSINVRELKGLFGLIRDKEGNIRPDIATIALGSLKTMCRTSGPSTFFNFSGNESGLQPQNMIFPAGAYTFCTWIRLERITSGGAVARLFSFFDKTGSGLVADFSGQFLHWRVFQSKKKSWQVQFDFAFETGRWYFITVCQSKKLLFNSSEVQFYVDGELKMSNPLKYPVMEHAPLEFSQIGTHDPVIINSQMLYTPPVCLSAQVGAIALFESKLSAKDIQNIYRCGPDFQFLFHKTDAPSIPFEWPFDDVIGTKLRILYNPRTCRGGICIENSLNSSHTTRPNALIRWGTQVCSTQNVKDTLHAMGGLQVLFPLLEFFGNQPTNLSQNSLCAHIITVMSEMIQHSTTNQETVINSNGFCLLGFLLAQIQPLHVNVSVLKALQQLLAAVAHSDRLVRDMYLHIFLDFKIWSRVPFEVQKELIIFVRHQVGLKPDYFHDLAGIQHFLDSLRFFYFYKPEKAPGSGDVDANSNNTTSPTNTGNNSNSNNNNNYNYNVSADAPATEAVLTTEQTRHLRAYLIEIIQIMARKTFTKEDLANLTSFLLDCTDDLQVVDLLYVLMLMVDEQIQGVINSLSDLTMFQPLFTLLKRDHKMIRIFCLKLIAKYIEKATPERKTRFEKMGSFFLIEHMLLMQQFDNATYSALMEICLNQATTFISPQKMVVDAAKIISCPAILGSIFHIIRDKDNLVKEIVLKDINTLLSGNPQNRLIFSQQFGWQNWFLTGLGNLKLENTDDDRSRVKVVGLSITCMSSIILDYVIKKDGWKVLQETLLFFNIASPDVEAIKFPLLRHLLYKMKDVVASTQMTKDSPLWENIYHIAQMVEEQIIFAAPEKLATNNATECLNVLQLMIELSDALAQQSIADPNAMLILHTDQFHSRAGAHGLIQSLMDLALSDQTKSSIPVQTLFNILFRTMLHVIRENTNHDARSHNLTRLAYLLCMDVDPVNLNLQKPHWKTTDTEIDYQRLVYILSYLCCELEKDSGIIFVPIFKSILRKNRATLPAILSENEKVRVLLQERRELLEDRSPPEDFLQSYLSVEWQCFKNSEPLHTAISQVNDDTTNFRKLYLRNHEKLSSELQKKLQKNGEREMMQLKSIVTDSLKKSQMMCFNELNRKTAIFAGKRKQEVQVSVQWKNLTRELSYHNRGIWGYPGQFGDRVFWKVDKTENSLRMRKKLKINYKGSTHEEASVHSKRERLSPGSEDSQQQAARKETEILRQYKVNQNDSGNQIDEEDEREWEAVNSNESTPAASTTESDTLNRESEEKLSCTVQCELVLPMNAVKGKLEITAKHLYFLVDRDDPSENDLFRFSKNIPKDKRWSLANIRDIFRRRYLLRQTALEIFFRDGTTVFFNFKKNDLYEVWSKITNQSLTNILFSTKFSQTPAQLFKRTKLTQKWVRREISNFEYLMALNTYAGRTYNDLTQYPVFPWVIKDYESEILDLSNPDTFRDLSKPIGALNPDRLEGFIERYESFSDPEIPQFHYGSHYSSVGTVLFYLLRLEPFTSYAIQLQSGQFDLPDRLFHSIPQTWHNAMTSNSDVKELIPEFFYCPEFLENQNSLDLGTKQDHEKLGDVVLPPWAKTPEEFIRLNREALESDYVSEHLHEWIDLIFGYKQRGKAAIEAHNVFYYLTYEGAVDLDAIDDPIIKKSMETQILNFGQTPSQLFKSQPHPKRNPRKEFLRQPYWNTNPQNAFLDVQVMSPGKPLISIMICGEEEQDRILLVGANRELKTTRWSEKNAPASAFVNLVNINNNNNNNNNDAFDDNNASGSGNKIGRPFSIEIEPSSAHFACSPDAKIILSCGHFDKSIKSTTTERCRVVQSVFKHKDVVTCLAMGEDGKTLVTGSLDMTLMVWTIYTEHNNFAAFASISEKPRHVLYGHEDGITCVAVNTDLDIVVSGSIDGTCKIHSLRHGRYVRSIAVPYTTTMSPDSSAGGGGGGDSNSISLNNRRKTRTGSVSARAVDSRSVAKVDMVALSNEGHIIVYTGYNQMIHLYSINGKLLHSASTMGDDLKAMVVTKDSKLLLTGGSGQYVTVRRVHDLRVVFEFNHTQSEIRSIAIKGERNVMVGLADGRLCIYCLDGNVVALN